MQMPPQVVAGYAINVDTSTDTFKAHDSGTFCIRVEQELVQAGGETIPGSAGGFW
jgi:hypothetical protein